MAMSRSRGGTLVTSRPPMTICPPDVSSSPAMQLSRVDLPQPDGPTSTRKSPCVMSMLIDFSTSTAAEALDQIAEFEHRRVRRRLIASAAMGPLPFSAPPLSRP